MRPYALLIIICFAPSLLSAQSKPGAQDTTTLTVDGQPDIQGLWTTRTTTSPQSTPPIEDEMTGRRRPATLERTMIFGGNGEQP